MGQYTFVVKKICPVCGQETRLIKTKSRILVQSVDEDYCSHCKDFSPYDYTMLVCEHCGFAADEKHFFKPMSEKIIDPLRSFLRKRKFKLVFNEERTLRDVEVSYRLAIMIAKKFLNAPLSQRAGMYLRFAWVYRLAETEPREERKFLRKAKQAYEESLKTERYPIETFTDTMALFLIGAINYRLGDYKECVGAFSQIISDPDVRQRESKLFVKTRDLWQIVRRNREYKGEDTVDMDEFETLL